MVSRSGQPRFRYAAEGNARTAKVLHVFTQSSLRRAVKSKKLYAITVADPNIWDREEINTLIK